MNKLKLICTALSAVLFTAAAFPHPGAAYAVHYSSASLRTMQDYILGKAPLSAAALLTAVSEDIQIEAPMFSAESGFYEDSFELTLESSADEIWYTTDGSDPSASESALLYSSPLSIADRTDSPNVLANITDISTYGYDPPDYNIDKGTVIRAAAKDMNGNFSRTVTHTYFVGDTASYYKDCQVVSLTTDPDGLFNSETGIYMIGPLYEDWLKGPDYNPYIPEGSPLNPTNYNNRGREYEVPGNICFFEDGEQVYSADIGIRINGNFSRALPQKGFRIYARSVYGPSKMKYPLIHGLTDAEGEPIVRFDKLLLHNGGNDNAYTRIRDMLIQSLCTDRAVACQGGEPCVVFLDGEYWGYYNLRERPDEDFFKSHFGVEKENVTFVKNSEATGDYGLAADFGELCKWGRTADMTIEENYQRVCSEIDIESLIDLMAIETYVNNCDFAYDGFNNFEMWRATVPDSGNPYADGRWRFVLNDLDITSGYELDKRTRYDYDSLTNLNQDNGIYFYYFIPMFYNLLKNDGFRQIFYERYTDIINTVFSYDRVSEAIDELEGGYGGYIIDTNRRFGITNDYTKSVRELREFFRRRPGYAEKYLKAVYEDPGIIFEETEE